MLFSADFCLFKNKEFYFISKLDEYVYILERTNRLKVNIQIVKLIFGCILWHRDAISLRSCKKRSCLPFPLKMTSSTPNQWIHLSRSTILHAQLSLFWFFPTSNPKTKVDAIVPELVSLHLVEVLLLLFYFGNVEQQTPHFPSELQGNALVDPPDQLQEHNHNTTQCGINSQVPQKRDSFQTV